MNILLINPNAYDIACYDYWLKPLGLLYISSILKQYGHSVRLIDCMDSMYAVSHEKAEKNGYGRGKYISERASYRPPGAPEGIDYRVYGMPERVFRTMINNTEKPDIIAVSSSMTYWYPAVFRTIEIMKDRFPDSRLFLGGIYASLCTEHASLYSGADEVVTGDSLKSFLEKTGDAPVEFPNWPLPDYSFYRDIPYSVLRTSQGCYKRCGYCGLGQLNSGYRRKTAGTVISEIRTLRDKYGIRDIVFYDDALLDNTEFIAALAEVNGLGLRFHTPNGLEVKKISPETARLLKKSGFLNPVLAVDIIGEKVSEFEFETAARNLYDAGYGKGEFSCYMIAGRPGQDLSELENDVDTASMLGVLVGISEYAVVPGSADAEKYFSEDILQEPLMHNNSLYPGLKKESYSHIQHIKQKARKQNRRLQQSCG